MLNDQQKAFIRVLDLVADADCLPHVILIGSWAEFAYREAGILPGFTPNIRTFDVDFLVRNLRRPVPPASLTSLAKERGFIVQSDSLLGTTKILDTSGLEVEFLINKKGAGLEPTLKTNVGVTAQALRHMDILSRHSIEAPCLRHTVRIPMPEAYVVHKMVINSQRSEKAEKDVDAVLGLWPYLSKEKFAEIMEDLSKKERARTFEFMEQHGLAIS